MSSADTLAPETPTPKPPRLVLDGVLAFPPNRDTMGGTAYWVQEEAGNILVDCPAWDAANRAFVEARGGVRWLVLTHRGAIAQAPAIQRDLHCEIVIQEQEAYLLPDLSPTTFQTALELSPLSRVLWTSGHSPGSACLYHQRHGGILFTGRHLLPNREGDPVPLRVSKTFHWPRQLRSIATLQATFSPETLQWICPGANTGFLRGKRAIDRAYERLSQLDLEALRCVPPGL